MPDVKSLVVKVRADSMLVMSEEGEFRSFPLPAQPPRVGEELMLAWPVAGTSSETDAPAAAARPPIGPLLAEPTATARPPIGPLLAEPRSVAPVHPPLLKRRRSWAPLAVAAAAVFALAFSPVAYGAWAVRQPAAVVAVDINPSLELTVDGRQQVAAATALNADAAKVLAQLQLKGLPVEQAVAEVVDRATDLGYIREDKPATVVATVVPLRQGARTPAPAELQSRIETELQSRDMNGYALGQGAGLEALQQAKADQLSLNQYLAMLKVRAAGVQVTADQARTMKVREILALAGLTPEGAFPGGAGVKRHGNGNGGNPGNGNSGSQGGKGRDKQPGAGDGKGAEGAKRDGAGSDGKSGSRGKQDGKSGESKESATTTVTSGEDAEKSQESTTSTTSTTSTSTSTTTSGTTGTSTSTTSTGDTSWSSTFGTTNSTSPTDSSGTTSTSVTTTDGSGTTTSGRGSSKK